MTTEYWPGELPCFDVACLAPTQRLVGLPPLAMRDAANGEPPRQKTNVRVGLQGTFLHVRFDGRDSGIRATLTERDGPLWTEDVYEVFLSPFDPPTVYFEFEVNPLGTLFDARVESPDLLRETMRVDSSWQSGFSARASRREDRWSAHLRIPLPAMIAGACPPLWRANFYRIDRGETDEFSAWSPTLRRPPDFHVPERFGRLRLPAPDTI